LEAALQSKLESALATESIDATELMESSKSETPFSLEDISKKVSMKHSFNLQIHNESVVTYRGSTAGGPYLNLGLARLRSCFVNDLENSITSRGSTLLALARSADSKGKLFNSLSDDIIDERVDAIG